MRYNKVYVEMVVRVKPDGYTEPITMVWDDGINRQKFEIDKVIEVRKGAALKAGGLGLRYLVRILGKDKILWYENPGWFVEVPENKCVARMDS